MYYYGARYYDPRISIFVSVDPLVEQTMTPYQYVHNNPIMFTDPTGMSAEGPGDGWASRTWSTIKSWFRGGSEYQSIPKNKPNMTVSELGPLEFNGNELEAGDSWYANGVTSTVINSTTVVNQPNVGDPYYSFIYPSDMGSWGQAGSDGKIWIGCMSCHGDNGAYRYAAYNSQEALAGYIAASVLNLAIGGALGPNAAKTQMNFSFDDLNSFKGAKSADVGMWLEQNGWSGIKTNSNRVYNDGMRFTNGVRGEQVRIMSGGATRSIPAKRGPYMEISRNNKKEVIELFGNPNL